MSKKILLIISSIMLLFSSCAKEENFCYPIWEGAEWVDSTYVLGQIDAQTYAISEPKVDWYYNTSYLILGEERAILFDTGFTGNLLPIVKKLTDLPIITLYSHFHIDHIANIDKQEDIWMIDLPYLRAKTKNNMLDVSFDETYVFNPNKIKVSKWIKPNEIIDLGGRQIQVVSNPGHTPETIYLLDTQYKQFFTGDFFYDPLLDYVGTQAGFDLNKIIARTNLIIKDYGDDYIFNGSHGAPKQSFAVFKKYAQFMENIRNGSVKPKVIVNKLGVQNLYEQDGMRLVKMLYGGDVKGQLIINIVAGFIFLGLLIFFVVRKWKKRR